MRKKKLIKVLKELQKEGEKVGVFYTLYHKSGHFISGKVLVVNEGFIQLESSHPIYFDPSTHCYVEKIVYKGEIIYQLKRKPSKVKPAK